MDDQRHTVPREAITGVATGLVMMAVFTSIWAGIAFGGLSGTIYADFVLGLFGVFAGAFIAYSIGLFKAGKHFAPSANEADIAEKKRTGKWFGIIFGAEGLGIFIAVNIVINLGHPELVIPAIALVVGLHFYPLAKVFKRKIDYYLATWATLVAVLSIILSLNKTLTEKQVMVLVGIGIAIATSGYGLYMLSEGKRLTKTIP